MTAACGQSRATPHAARREPLPSWRPQGLAECHQDDGVDREQDTSVHVRRCAQWAYARDGVSFSREHAAMTRRGPSRRRLSGSLRRRQGSSRRADPFGAGGLDRASRVPRIRSCVIARLGDPASRVDEAIEDGDPPTPNRPEISIAHCRDLLGDDACALSDEEIETIRRRADAMAHILVEIFLQNLPSRG
jgi:hypothetical protein